MNILRLGRVGGHHIPKMEPVKIGTMPQGQKKVTSHHATMIKLHDNLKSALDNLNSLENKFESELHKRERAPNFQESSLQGDSVSIEQIMVEIGSAEEKVHNCRNAMFEEFKNFQGQVENMVKEGYSLDEAETFLWGDLANKKEFHKELEDFAKDYMAIKSGSKDEQVINRFAENLEKIMQIPKAVSRGIVKSVKKWDMTKPENWEKLTESFLDKASSFALLLVIGALLGAGIEYLFREKKEEFQGLKNEVADLSNTIKEYSSDKQILKHIGLLENQKDIKSEFEGIRADVEKLEHVYSHNKIDEMKILLLIIQHEEFEPILDTKVLGIVGGMAQRRSIVEYTSTATGYKEDIKDAREIYLSSGGDISNTELQTALEKIRTNLGKGGMKYLCSKTMEDANKMIHERIKELKDEQTNINLAIVSEKEVRKEALHQKTSE